MSDNTSPLVTAAWSFLVLVVFLLLWEYGPGWVGMPEFVLPPLSRVAEEAVRIWQTERLLWHAGITALEVVIGFVLGSAMGALIGYALGVSPRVEAILSPYLLALQIAPKVAFAPLFVMWLGYTIYPKILVAILIVFFPVLINVLSAMRAMDTDMINLARSFSATRMQVFRMVEYPTTLPSLFSGLRIASTLAVIGVVVGELVGGNMGLGFMLVFFEGQGNTAAVFVVIAALTVIGIIAYYAVVLAERKVLHYLPSAQRRMA
ncbi:MAG: ABC transporter permease [Burkholderiaceae bacterium]|nr:ABC transporter permease [Rhodoferax sp.]MCB2003654.1 ABC transporter permease [Rhodoferax sp.]MCB2029758.1 ABC transporter permease [Rhodoferax sp.]MCW5644429.1 ABC transporter permease [Rhodoferax sp.]MCZ4316950.1 ABC transporter permease [Comamonadaceae bacterium G21597-S1]